MVEFEISVSGIFQKSFCFARDDEFFVRRNHHELHAGARFADDGFRGPGAGVEQPVDALAAVVELGGLRQEPGTRRDIDERDQPWAGADRRRADLHPRLRRCRLAPAGRGHRHQRCGRNSRQR